MSECKACGATVDPSAATELCSICRRAGCSSCLRAVAERADDFFFDLWLCRECLARESIVTPCG